MTLAKVGLTPRRLLILIEQMSRVFSDAAWQGDRIGRVSRRRYARRSGGEL